MEIEGKEDGFFLEADSTMELISRDPLDLVEQANGNYHQYPDGFVLFLGTLFAPTQDRDHKIWGLLIKLVIELQYQHLN